MEGACLPAKAAHAPSALLSTAIEPSVTQAAVSDRADSYRQFLARKSQIDSYDGFEPINVPDFLFDFQAYLLEWACRKGRAAVFADCGMGKTPIQLAWADNVARHTGGRVLILTPLAVSHQTVGEAHKFGFDADRSVEGELTAPIVITNYERLDRFDPSNFEGVICDESSILKSFDGVRRQEITNFMRKMRYRLLCTATAAPNDWTELGTSSEALGYLGFMDMLNRFFRNDQNNSATSGRLYGKRIQWRLKGHAEEPFFRWVCSWARAARQPSDLGFTDEGFELPGLKEREHVVEATCPPEGALFSMPAEGLQEQRKELKRTMEERCEKVADLVNHDEPAVVWCQLNQEGDLLEKLIPDACQVSGRDADDVKEERLSAFSQGEHRVLITKPRIGGWGLNWQHCAHVTFFPSHSYEELYQAIRRCWRFGQDKTVTVDLVTTDGTRGMLDNIRRKSEQADRMFASLVRLAGQQLEIASNDDLQKEPEVPSWL